jgi:trigger factor
MNIVVEKQPKCSATLRVEIPAQNVQDQRQQIVSRYAGAARVPGFRPGKAPRAIVEKRFAKAIGDELHESLIGEAFQEALKREDVRILDIGKPEQLSELPDGGISFVSKLTLAPEITLPGYKGIRVTVPPTAVPDADVQAELRGLQERFAEFKDVEGRGAEIGDFGVIDYQCTIEGQAVSEFLGKPAGFLEGRDGFWIKIDDDSFLPGFAAGLIGMTPGASRDIPLTLADDFPLADLQGKTIVIHATLKELKEAELPALDDAFAAKLMPDKTIDDLTTLVRDHLADQRQRRIHELKAHRILETLSAQIEFELPEEYVTRETQAQADQMVQRGIQAGMSDEDIEARQGDLFSTAANQAVANLRNHFILKEIARLERIEVSDQELSSHIFQLAASRNVEPKKLIKELRGSGRLQDIRNSLVTAKAVDFLVTHAEVEESTETESDA